MKPSLTLNQKLIGHVTIETTKKGLVITIAPSIDRDIIIDLADKKVNYP